MRLCVVLAFALFLTNALECAASDSDHEARGVLLPRLKREREQLTHRGGRRRKTKQVKRAKRKKSKNSKRKGKDDLFHPTGLTNCECGTHNLEETRIVNGTESQPNAYPWMALILLKKYGDKENIGNCGGSVITTKYILTAAHCLEYYKPKELRVRLGDHHWRADDIPRAYYADVKEFTMHEKYDPFTLDNDIGVVKINLTIEFFRDRSVGPICLPSPSRNYNKKEVIATGWGTTKNNAYKLSPVLLEFQSTMVSSKRCQKDFPFPEGDITENMICTDIITGDTCQGDSGGPLIYRDPNSDRFVQLGITSWGYKCNKKLPGVYTKVVNYLSWIFKNTRGSKYCQPLDIPEKQGK